MKENSKIFKIVLKKVKITFFLSFSHGLTTRSLDLSRVRRHFQKSQADRQTDEQTTTFIKILELAKKAFKKYFMTNQWTD